jgi:hypothetical protein
MEGQVWNIVKAILWKAKCSDKYGRPDVQFYQIVTNRKNTKIKKQEISREKTTLYKYVHIFTIIKLQIKITV